MSAENPGAVSGGAEKAYEKCMIGFESQATAAKAWSLYDEAKRTMLKNACRGGIVMCGNYACPIYQML